MSDDLSVRDWLKAQLTPLLPDDWDIIEFQSIPQKLTTTTVIIKHLEMQRLPEAPTGNIRHRLVVTVADNHENPKTAESALDDSVLELCTALDALPSATWTGAEKVLVEAPYIGWDITLTVITTKK